MGTDLHVRHLGWELTRDGTGPFRQMPHHSVSGKGQEMTARGIGRAAPRPYHSRVATFPNSTHHCSSAPSPVCLITPSPKRKHFHRLALTPLGQQMSTGAWSGTHHSRPLPAASTRLLAPHSPLQHHVGRWASPSAEVPLVELDGFPVRRALRAPFYRIKRNAEATLQQVFLETSTAAQIP